MSTLPPTFSRRVRSSSCGRDGKVVFQHLDERQIGEGFAMRHRKGFQYQPLARGAELELIHQTGFADAWLTHDRHDLPLALLHQGQGALHLGELRLAAHKRHQTTARRHLEARAQRTDPHHFV